MRAVLCLLLLGGVAAAGGRKVLVESDPPGATVYLNDKEAGPVCSATPCTIDVPASGDANIIVEASGYAPEFVSVDLSKKGKLSAKATLKKAMGTIVVDAPKGAAITVDDTDEGKAPQRIEIEAGGHHVVLTQNGKSVFDDFVDVGVNDEIPIEPKAAGAEPTDTENVLEQKVEPVKKPHDPWIYGLLAVDVGFRKFTYSGTTPGMTSKLREEDESGEVLAGPALEIYPMAIAGLDVAKGLAILFRYQYGLNSQKVQATGLSSQGLTTFWQSLEISAKYRWVLFEQLGLEVGGGYARDTYRFNGMDSDILAVPDADYQGLRIGVRAAYLAEVGGTKLEPYLAVEPRLVTDGGNLKTRYQSGSVTGLHGALGVLAHFGSFTAKLEGALTSYSWTLTPKSAAGDYNATGASDSIKYLAFGVGYTY